jgi:hypothetical protein
MNVRGSLVLNLAVGLACLLVQACDRKADDTAWWEGEQEKAGLESRLDLLKYRHSIFCGGSAKDTVSLSDQVALLTRKRDELAVERGLLLTDIAALEAELSGSDRERMKRARAAALGKHFDRLTLVGGTTFENALVVKIEDLGVSIRHKHGAATLKYGDLSPAQREKFGLDAESALAAEIRDFQRQADYDRWMEKEMAALAVKHSEAAARATLESERVSKLRTAVLAKAQSDYQSRPLAKPASPIGSGSIWRRSWYEGYYDYPYRRRSVVYYIPSNCYTPSNYSSCRSSIYKPSSGGHQGTVRQPDRIQRREVPPPMIEYKKNK